MAGWCSATVKDVVGADTLVVVAAAKNPNAPPPEKHHSLVTHSASAGADWSLGAQLLYTA